MSTDSGFRRVDPTHEFQPGEHWWTVTQAISGHFAVEMWVNNQNPKLGTFSEPWDTGLGRYRTEREAWSEAYENACANDQPIAMSEELFRIESEAHST